MKHCDFKQVRQPQDVCVVSLEQFGSCSQANGYGYPKGKPCIFLKLNKIYGWAPEVYDAPVSSMPQDLQQVINATAAEEVQCGSIKMNVNID